MKTFLNVLYRRILYKIPLKLLLVLLAVFVVLFVCFSNAENIDSLVTYIGSENTISIRNTYYKLLDLNSSNRGNTYCLEISSANNVFFLGYNSSLSDNTDLSYAYINNGDVPYMCITYSTYHTTDYLFIYYPYSDKNLNLTYRLFELNALFNTQIPVLSSIECQQEYNLIPISEVDSNYCQTNNLCPSCPVCPSVPVGSGGYSQLYINNILHLGAPNIIMNIPDEIDWDYAYTQGGQNMNIDVVGYNVDYEKIDSIVQFQNYKPSSEDFQKIIGLLAPYTKIIVFFVFLFIVWAWIKKPFKSKKL